MILIDELNSRMVDEDSYDTWNAFKRAKALATELLETEKENIVEAYCCGDMDYDKIELPETRAETYYKERYEKAKYQRTR